jgi:hypothetical protein
MCYLRWTYLVETQEPQADASQTRVQAPNGAACREAERRCVEERWETPMNYRNRPNRRAENFLLGMAIGFFVTLGGVCIAAGCVWLAQGLSNLMTYGSW